jgi:hypothetical protein
MRETGKKTAFKSFLGIDISKEKFDACCIGSTVKGTVLFLDFIIFSLAYLFPQL